MTSQIAESENNRADVQVDLGNGRMVNMQTIQHIYNEITGRSEELARRYTLNHCVSFDDLRQLNIKICQLHEQYNIVSRNCSVTLFHVDDQKQVYSSFERFDLYDRTTLSPVENVRLEYHFLIILPQVNKPQSYTIEINILSRAALAKRARSESPLPQGYYYQYIAPTTARMEITYVDYTVARNFQVAIDAWFKALPEIPGSKVLRPIKELSPEFSFIFRFLSGFIFLLVCYHAFTGKSSLAPSSISNLFLVALLTFGGTFLLTMVSGHIGHSISNTIRHIQQKSFLNLTRGDEIALKELTDENQSRWFAVIVSTVGAIVVNVFSSWLAIKVGVGG